MAKKSSTAGLISSVDEADEDDDQVDQIDKIELRSFSKKRRGQSQKPLIKEQEQSQKPLIKERGPSLKRFTKERGQSQKRLTKEQEPKQGSSSDQPQSNPTNPTNQERFFFNFDRFRNLTRMSIIKGISAVLALLVAVLITFLITYYSVRCPQSREPLPDSSPSKNVTKAVRLSTNVIPFHYDLKMQPFLRKDQLQFNGSVSILVICKKSTNQIRLHANELRIDSERIKIKNIDGDPELANFKIKNYTYENELITLELDKNLEENNKYSIDIRFGGRLKGNLAGFYRSSYTDAITNETVYFAMTQFQPTDARRAFPCFDEPAFKATFDLTMFHWKNMTAIANMPIFERIESDGAWVKTKFERTVKMSTYLLAFAVGEFKAVGSVAGNIKYQIVTRPSEIDGADKAIEYGPRVLSHFEEYFKIKFPLPKMDMFATPDFAAGAMENWGLIIYRETYLLFTKKMSSVVQLYRICSVISHELAHQWFGNLVTPKWWNDLWLNEGFATFMSYEGVNKVEPGWKIWDRFVIDEIQDVLGLDSLKNSHSISVTVNDPSEISEIFDHISYAKGAAIIRMLSNTLTKENFRKGITRYLKKFSYGNAEQRDLWHHLQLAYNESGSEPEINVQKMMNSWTLKAGYPLITVKADYKNKKLHFSQRRFLLNSNETTDAAMLNEQYEVPITFMLKNEKLDAENTRVWLHETSDGSESKAVVNVDGLNENDWLLANLRQVGYYRVNYDERNWDLLINQLEEDHTKINRVNRAQILDDLFHLAENDVVNYKLALRALKYFKKETDALPWGSIGSLTYMITRMLRRSDSYGEWQKYLRNIAKDQYELIGFKEPKNPNDLHLNWMQKAVTSLACVHKIGDCVPTARAMFNEFMNTRILVPKSENKIPTNVRPTVYCTAIKYGDIEEWDFLFSLYMQEQNANERAVILNALTCSRIPWIISRLLKWTFDESSGIKTQDSVLVFKSISAQNYGKDIAFNYLRENWETIYDIHGKAMSFGHIVRSLDGINTEFELKMVKDFYRSIGNKVGSGKRAFLQTMEQIEANINWMKKYEKVITGFAREENLT